MAAPSSPEEAAEALRDLGVSGQPVRVHGSGTKLGWSISADPSAIRLHTTQLNRILEHNEGDFTAVVQAGVKLADLQAELAAHGQMVALDPPLGQHDAATVGGVVATADSGPLRHRYGGVRDLLLGITVVLSDGTVARAGGKVIKNVAGYDLGKLFAGSRGTLGLIAEVSLRLHPLPDAHATVRAHSQDHAALATAAAGLAALPLEADALDVAWRDGRGELLVRFGGRSARERAESAASRIGLDATEIVEDDDALWAAQRTRQRGTLVAKVAGVISGLEEVLRTADRLAAGVVARAGLGLAWVALPEGADVQGLRDALPQATVTVLDGAARVREPHPAPPAGALVVMERVKARFDPARIFAPLGEAM